jgi:hypothetical protein
MNALPVCIQYAQAIALILIPLIGALIAWQQVKIGRIKLQHDLYDKRFAVFQTARKLLANVLADRNVSNDQVDAYVVGTSDSVFLLDEETSKYLKEILERVIQLQAIKETMESLDVGKQRSDLIKREGEIFSWLGAQLPVGLVASFKPFLTLDIQKRPAYRRLLSGLGVRLKAQKTKRKPK